MSVGLPIGELVTAPVVSEADQGLYLRVAGEDVLLPGRLVPEGARVGDVLRVFVPTDSEDRPVLTTEEPAALLGEFALLEVVDLSEHGAFLDWGLDKDLFAPFGEQVRKLAVGDRMVFRVCLDERTGRLFAASRLAPHFDYDVSAVRAGDEVELLVYGQNEIGALVVVDGRHTGLVYRNEAFRPLRVGDALTGWVKQVREDNKLDIRLQRSGRAAIDDAEEVILEALRAGGGWLALHDKSPPEQIRAELRMSKKAFKRALGGLYKARRVALEEGGVRLLD